MQSVSGRGRDSVIVSLSALGLREKVEVIVCAGDYRNSKPHPEPFLAAAERLGIAPEHCLVFEDSEVDIQAAIAAGVASVKVPCPSEDARTFANSIQISGIE
jgi:HAD superfamily hydrolase (TIGR01509 family)